MTIDLGRYSVVSDRGGPFPWTKFERLLKLTEIFNPQWEDGVSPDPNVAMPIPTFSPSQFVWLVMEEEKAWGFIMNGIRGKYWVDAHLGFRRGLPGLVKKAACLFVMSKLFNDLGYRKITAIIPEFNTPARVFVRAIGYRPEGRIASNVWRLGVAYDSVVYGVTRDEFLVWAELFGPKCAAQVAKQPGHWTDSCTEQPN